MLFELLLQSLEPTQILTSTAVALGSIVLRHVGARLLAIFISFLANLAILIALFLIFLASVLTLCIFAPLL